MATMNSAKTPRGGQDCRRASRAGGAGERRIDALVIFGYLLTVVGTVVGVACWGVTSPLLAVAGVALAAAVVGLALAAPKRFDISVSRRDRLGRPSPGRFHIFLMFPALAVFFAGDWTPHFLSATPLLLAGLATAAIAGPVAYLQSRRGLVASPIQFVVIIAAMAAMLGSGAAGLLDVRLDTSPPKLFHATVRAMHVEHWARSTHYFVSLSPWGPRKVSEDVDVRGEGRLYDQLHPGDQVCIRWREGAFDIPWFTVNACPGPS